MDERMTHIINQELGRAERDLARAQGRIDAIEEWMAACDNMEVLLGLQKISENYFADISKKVNLKDAPNYPLPYPDEKINWLKYHGEKSAMFALLNRKGLK